MRADADGLVRSASTAASLALAAMLAITLAFVAWPRVASALGIEPAPPAPAYAPGGTIDTPAAWHSRTPATLVLFARASCSACQKGQPFLASLVADLRDRADVVVVGGSAEDAEFARSIGVDDSRIQMAPAGLRVRVTPTLVLVDRAGTILHAWEGVGPEEKQTAIAQALQRALTH
jgi:peroxiredoxin